MIAIIPIGLWFNRAELTIETNLLALLPNTGEKIRAQRAIDEFAGKFTREAVFLIGSGVKEKARDASLAWYKALLESKLFKTVRYRIDQDSAQSFLDLYSPYRSLLLSGWHRRQLEADNIGAVLTRSMKDIYSPIGFSAESLEKDPLLLFQSFLGSLPRPHGQLNLDRGLLVVESNGMKYVLVSAVLADDPFGISSQEKVSKSLSAAQRELHDRFNGIEILSSGVVFHAIAGTDSAKRDISVIASGSLAGIVLLMIISFKTLKPLGLCLIPVITGFLAAFTVCQLVFASLHIFTLVFGASLIGISADYCFHYIAHQYFGRETHRSALPIIFPGITLAMATTVVAFLGLSINPFPGLQQIALFSAIGIFTAYCTVVCWFPLLIKNKLEKKPVFLLSMLQLYLKFWKWLGFRKAAIAVLCAAPLVVAGIMLLMPRDDIRLLQTPFVKVMAEQEAIERLINNKASSQFFLVFGNDEQALLENEEILTDSLESLVADKRLDSYQGISPFQPSILRQRENYRLVKEKLIHNESLVTEYFDQLGFTESSTKNYVEQLSTEPAEFLTPQVWKRFSGADFLENLRLGQTERGYTSVVTLAGIGDEARLKKLAEELESVEFIDKVGEISGLFAKYRKQATLSVMLAYILILGVLLIRYGKRGFVLVIPPALSALLAVAVLGYLGEPINLFNTLALLLVLGIGIDYAVFYHETRNDSQTTSLAIFLSAITTVLSFGLLALSRTYAIHSFGLTVLLGIAFAFLISPLVLSCDSNHFENQPGI